MKRTILVAFAMVTIACACSGLRTGTSAIPHAGMAPAAVEPLPAMPAASRAVSGRVVVGKNKQIYLPMPSGFSAVVRVGARGVAATGTVVYAVTTSASPKNEPGAPSGALLFTQLTPSLSMQLGTTSHFRYTVPRAQLGGKGVWVVAAYDPSNPTAGWQLGYTSKAVVTGSTVDATVAAPSFVAAGLTYGFALVKGPGALPVTSQNAFEMTGTLTQVSNYFYPSPSPEPSTVTTESVVQYYTVSQSPTTAPAPLRGASLFAAHVTEVDTQPLETSQQASDDYFQPGADDFSLLAGSIGYSFSAFAKEPDTTTTVFATPQQLVPVTPGQTSWTNSPEGSIVQRFADGQRYTRDVSSDGSYEETGHIPNPAATPIAPAIVERVTGAGSYSGPSFAGRRFPTTACSYAFAAPSAGTSKATIAVTQVLRQSPTSKCGSSQPLTTVAAWFGTSPALYRERDVAVKTPTLPKSCGPFAGTKQKLLVTRTVKQLDTIVGYDETLTTKTYYASGGVACIVFRDVIDEYYDWKGDVTEPGSNFGAPYLSPNGDAIATVETSESLWAGDGASATVPNQVAAPAQAHFLARIAHVRGALRQSAMGRPARGTDGTPAATFAWGSVARDQMSYDGEADGRQPMRVFVQVKMRDANGLLQAAQDDSTPGSATYRRFLTPRQIAEKYLASASDYDRVAAYFSGLGLQVVRYPQRDVVEVAGTVAQMARAFGTTFGRFHYHGAPAIAPVGAPRLSADLPVTSVLGLVQHARFSLMMPIRANSANFYGYSPQQVANGLDFSAAYGVGYKGSGIVAGVVALGKIDPADRVKYHQRYHWPMAPISDVTPLPAIPPMQANGGQDGNSDNTEPALDTQTVAALAPGAHEEYLENDAGWYQAVELAIARNRDDTISLSESDPEPIVAADGAIKADGTGVYQIALAALATEGIAFFASSGDSGSADYPTCLYPSKGDPTPAPACVGYPAEDSNAVGVGAVNLPLDAAGNVVGQITAWSDETTHGGPIPSQRFVGSGGGYSRLISAPPWQKLALSSSPTYTGYREVPDVAFDGAPQTGMGTITFGTPSLGFGTSEAAPMANAAWVVLLSACKQSPSCSRATGAKPYRLGNPAPLLYGVYQGKDAGGLPYANVAYDVLYGDNTPVGSPPPSISPVGYSAGPGYDLVTGIGTPFVGHLVDALIVNAGVP